MNAKQELIEHLVDNGLSLKCANVSVRDFNDNIKATLSVNHTNDELLDFLHKLDVEYDSGDGIQGINGILWHTNDSWSERRGYDDSEWWEHNPYPEIPKELLNVHTS